MITETFKPKNREQPSLLPRDRPQDNSIYIVFEQSKAATDGFEVYVDKRVLEQITNACEKAAPNETIGLLGGRTCKDSTGPYTLIVAAEGAREGEVDSTPGHVKISGQGHAQIRQRLESNLPYLEIVGWYHSHPTYHATFSLEDSNEQSTWTDQNHIGIVVSGRSDTYPFGVYRGPKSTQLQRRTAPPATEPIQSKEEFYDPIYPRIDKKKEESAERSDKDEPAGSKYIRVHQDTNPEYELLSRRMKHLALATLFSVLILLGTMIWLIFEVRASERRMSNLIEKVSGSAVNRPSDDGVSSKGSPTATKIANEAAAPPRDAVLSRQPTAQARRSQGGAPRRSARRRR